jgi:hypothetical protein
MFVEARGTKYAYRSIGKDPGAPLPQLRTI